MIRARVPASDRCGERSAPPLTLLNRNGAKVPAYTFLDPAFAPISAIWAVDLDGSSACGGLEPTLIIHSPNATNPIPQGFLPADAEYVCSNEGDDLILERVPRDRRSDT